MLALPSLNQIAKLLVLKLIAMLLLLHCYKFYYKQQNPLYAAGIKSLPPKVRQILRSKPLPKHLALFVIKDRQVMSYNNTNDDHWAEKTQKVLHTLLGIQQSADPIPDGYYLLSLEDGVHAKYYMPLLAFASDQNLVTTNKVVLIPDFEAHSGYTNLLQQIRTHINQYPWSQKQAKIFWRGGANGDVRIKFMHDVAPQLDFIDAGFIGFGTGENKKQVAYLQKNFVKVPTVSPTESMSYKYLLDMDGYSCSYSRVAWILSSNSLLLKHASNKVQWYYNKMQPFIHYVPIKADFSDLAAQFAWAEANPAQAQEIINNAQILANEVFAESAITAATRQGFKAYFELTQQH